MNELRYLLLVGQTQMLRFWFGIMGCFFALFLLTPTAAAELEYLLTFQVMIPQIWSLLLIINGISFIYGSITSKYSHAGLFFEGILGTAIWSGLGITSMISQGSVGAVLIAIIMNTFLLIRYPTWQENL